MGDSGEILPVQEMPRQRHLCGGIGGLPSVESPNGAPQVAVGGSGEIGLPSVESPYGVPQGAVGNSGVAPPDAAAASHT